MKHVATALTGLALSIAALAALGTPAPRLWATGCTGKPLGLALAYQEDELPVCTTVQRLPWIQE